MAATNVNANITATQFEIYRSMYGGKLDHWEQRGSDYAALRTIQAESNPNDPESIIDARVEANVKQSFGIGVQVPVIKYFEPTITTTRTCTFATEGAISQLVTLTFVTYGFGFLMAPRDHFNNYVDYDSLFAKQMTGALQAMAKAMDEDVVDLLENNRNTYWPSEITDFYNESGDALRPAQADKSDFYNNLSAILATMDYPATNVKVVTNNSHRPMVNFYSQQGAQNGTNYGFQFGPYGWAYTNRVLNGSGVESTGYAFPKGSIGMMTRLDPSAMNRDRIHESKYWDVFPNAPFVNMDLGVYYEADCANITTTKENALAGLTQAKKESWKLSVDTCYITSYVSRADDSPAGDFQPIVKFEILSS